MSALWEDIIRFTALSITIICTVYNLYCTYKENSCSTHIKKIIKWYVKAYQKGIISEEDFVKGMNHITELSKITKGSNTENPKIHKEK